MLKIIKILLLIAMSLPIYAELDIEFQEYGFFPEDNRTAKINTVKQINNDFYAVGANGLVIKIIEEDWEYIRGANGLPEILDIMKLENDFILLNENNKFLYFDKHWEYIKAINIESEGKLIKIEQNKFYTFLLADNGEILYTENSFIDWKIFDTPFEINNIIINNPDVFFVANSGKYYHSANEGKTFKTINVQDTINIHSISKYGSQISITGDMNYIMYSPDNGETWEQKIAPISVKQFGQIKFLDDTTLLSSFRGGSIISHNLGEKWKTHLSYYDTNYITKIIKNDSFFFIYKNDLINKYTSNEIFNHINIFKQCNINLKKIHCDFQKKNIELLSGNNYLYKPINHKNIFRKMEFPILTFNDVYYQDSLIYILKDSTKPNLKKIKSKLFVYDIESNFKYSISLDSGLFARKIFSLDHKLFLYNIGSQYYFIFDKISKKIEKIDMTDSLRIRKIKYFNANIYILATSNDFQKNYIISLDSQYNIENINILPIEKYFVDFYVKSNNEIIAIQNVDDVGHTSDTYIYIINSDYSGFRTVFTHLDLIQNLQDITYLGNNKYIAFGSANIVYTDDNFDTYDEYISNTPAYFEDFNKISNKLLTIKGKKLHSVSLHPSIVEDMLINSIPIYPNPISIGETLNIKLDNSILDYTTKIYNIEGFLVAEYSNQFSIPITNYFTTGTYFIVIESNGRIISRNKFLVK